MTPHPLRLAAAGGAILAITAGAAEAHAHLLSSTPAANATVAAAPSELDLTFSESVTLRFTGVMVTGPAKSVIPTGAAMLKAKDTELVVPLAAALPAGAYGIAWHALSTDGHKTQGTYTFTVKPE